MTEEEFEAEWLMRYKCKYCQNSTKLSDFCEGFELSATCIGYECSGFKPEPWHEEMDISKMIKDMYSLIGKAVSQMPASKRLSVWEEYYSVSQRYNALTMKGML